MPLSCISMRYISDISATIILHRCRSKISVLCLDEEIFSSGTRNVARIARRAVAAAKRRSSRRQGDRASSRRERKRRGRRSTGSLRRRRLTRNVAMKTATATAWRTSDGGEVRTVVPAIRRTGLPGAIRVTIFIRIVGAGTSRGVRGSSTARIRCRGA